MDSRRQTNVKLVMDQTRVVCRNETPPANLSRADMVALNVQFNYVVEKSQGNQFLLVNLRSSAIIISRPLQLKWNPSSMSVISKNRKTKETRQCLWRVSGISLTTPEFLRPIPTNRVGSLLGPVWLCGLQLTRPQEKVNATVNESLLNELQFLKSVILLRIS